MSRHLSTGGAATESDTDGGESEDGGQPSTPGGTPIERRVRAASLHTIATVEALEAEGKRVEAAEVLAAQLAHLKAISDGETGGRPEAASSSAATSMPPLPEACEVFKRELGVDGKNLFHVVVASCEMLGVADVKGDPLIRKAEKCWACLWG